MTRSGAARRAVAHQRSIAYRHADRSSVIGNALAHAGLLAIA
jgi:hypothetical protein